MNGNLEAVLYDCKHIGSIARDIQQRLKLLESTAGRIFHDSIRKDYPNITNVEEFIRRHHAQVQINELQQCFDELKEEMQVFPREALFPDAADMYNEFRKEAKAKK